MTDRLLRLLTARTNRRGIALATAEALQTALACSFQDLDREVSALARSGAIDVLSPLPWLVAKVLTPYVPLAPGSDPWAGVGVKPPSSTAKSGPAVVPAYSFQSSLSHSERLKESYRPGGAEESLLQEILDTLGESDPTTFRGAVRHYPAGVIRTALARIRGTWHVRRNRTALFRYLLPRIAKEPPFNS